MREILFRAKGNKKYNNGGWYFGGGIGTDCDGDCYCGSKMQGEKTQKSEEE